MNQYLKNLNRIEFVVTMACTGKCKHCSEGDHVRCPEHIDADVAAAVVQRICERHRITSLMTFGGEALLYPDTVCAIHSAATALGIPQRQLITNGFFSNRPERIEAVARALADSGVNDLLLSVDAFHQETIPIVPVKAFAVRAVEAGIPVRLNPAWLVSPEDDNPYNARTRALLAEFETLKVPAGPGDVIFPSGNALKYLREYFDADVTPSSPYDEDPRDLRTISFCANGDVLNGNVYRTDILEIMEGYDGEETGDMR
ncbi:MAG: radical SAM protein [Clostridia bacterium]|nr:radical SAM protein [Clostridia bacterium]